MKNQEFLNLSGTANILFEESGQVDNPGEELGVYYNSINNDAWVSAGDESSIAISDIAGGEAYEMLITNLGWVMSGRPYTDNNESTIVTVTTNRNETGIIDQKVFLLFDEFNGMAALPLNGSTFSASDIPLNHSATIVAIAFDKFQFYFASESVTITDNLELNMNMRAFNKTDFILLVKSID